MLLENNNILQQLTLGVVEFRCWALGTRPLGRGCLWLLVGSGKPVRFWDDNDTGPFDDDNPAWRFLSATVIAREMEEDWVDRLLGRSEIAGGGCGRLRGDFERAELPEPLKRPLRVVALESSAFSSSGSWISSSSSYTDKTEWNIVKNQSVIMNTVTYKSVQNESSLDRYTFRAN